MKHLFKSVAFACATFVLAPAVQAEEFTVAFASEKPPFSYRDSKGVHGGIEVDVVRTVLQRLGHTMKATIVPNSRLPSSLAEGAKIAAAVQGKDGNGQYFSDDFVEYVNVAISKAEKNAVINTSKDLDNYKFVIWQKGYADLGPEFEAKYKPDAKGAFRPNYNQAPNQRAQNLMFWSNRVDVIVVDKTIFDFFKKELSKEANTTAPVKYHEIFNKKTGFPIVTRDQALRDKFNEALRAIRADGTYDKIVAKYKG